MSAQFNRKLTTIMAADAEGYSRAMAEDEPRTIADLRASRSIFSRFIERHGGRIANTAGDGLIADFPSVVEAVQCAVEVQNELRARDGATLRFRIGIHLGNVIVDGDDLLGDGVNIAARLQSMAEPGGVLISRQVYDQVHSKLTVGFQHLGERHARNLPEDVDVYRIAIGSAAAAAPRAEPEMDSAVFLSPPEPRQAAAAEPERPPRASDQTAAPETDTSPEPPADNPPPPPKMRQATRSVLGVAGFALFVDLVTGPGFWAHWVILPAVTAYALYVAPQYATDRVNIRVLRVAIPAAALVLINLFTWSGTFWAIWPVAGFVAFAVMGGKRSDKGA